MKKIVLSIEGMTCSACSNGLEKYLNKQNGIESAVVNLVMATASITYNEEFVTLEDLDTFVKRAGFKSLGEFKELKDDDKDKKAKNIFLFFSLLVFVFMYFAMGHMINLPTIDFVDMNYNPRGYILFLFSVSIIFILYGLDIIKSGFTNLFFKNPNMDTLVTLGVFSSLIFSIYNMFLYFKGYEFAINSLYFESVVMIIYFVKLGRYIDRKLKNKTKDAISKLVSITPLVATIKKEGKEQNVTIDCVNIGDIVVTKPGERVSVDGVIVNGKTHVDESFITGESKPVSKNVGDNVIAGSINYDGYIEYKAYKIGQDSCISEIVKLVIAATNTKPKIAKLADKVSGYFVPLVIVLALLTFIGYLFLGNSFSQALNYFVTVLVVACPCSLGLATPLSVVVSEGKCASKGILIKNSEVLEIANKIDTVVFDKTGTLTYGELKIAEILNFSNLSEEEMLKFVCSLESKSTHPIAKAFSTYLKEHKINRLEVTDFKEIIGYGIVGKVNNDDIIIGTAKILKKYKIKNDKEIKANDLAKKGNTIIYVVINHNITSIVGINDVIKEDAFDVIDSLKKRKIETIMLTGDNKDVATNVSKALKIDKSISNVLPKDKTRIINELKDNNKHVMMCGDGINDSPALASALIGVSFQSGTDIAMDSSSVILTRNNLSCILDLINISNRTIKVIKQNLFWAFFYNFLMIPIAMGVFKNVGLLINPMLASLAMVLSSITVILNTLRLNIDK